MMVVVDVDLLTFLEDGRVSWLLDGVRLTHDCEALTHSREPNLGEGESFPPFPEVTAT